MHSHEVTPAIGDIFQKQDGIQLEIRLNLEALLSGIDLSDISNTDEATPVSYTHLTLPTNRDV